MKTRLQDLFQSLSVKNYRIYFVGQGISLIGTWMQRTTMGWFVYRLTGSAFLLGLIGFLSQIPSVFIGPFAGVWADKWHRLNIIKVTQFLALIQALTLGILVLTNNIQIWHVVALSLLSGVIEAVDAPARQSFVIELVEKKSLLTNAIALNSASFNGARLIGPSLAGIIIALSSEGMCFLINGLSYIAVIISLFMIIVPVREHLEQEYSMLTKIKQGWKYSFHHLPIRYFITNISVITMFGMSYAVLMPIFAKDILHGSAQTLGYLMSMSGVGALTGALYLASRKSIRGLSTKMVYALVVFSVALILFSLSRNFYLSLGLMVLVGIGMMFQMSTSNTILQTVVDDDMRGRVMSLHSMAFMSIAPFGSLMVGSLTKSIGAPLTLSICAFICLLWAGYGISLQKKLVPVINSMVKKHELTNAAAYEVPDLTLAVNK
jgi:MFS family permease